jgi:hypothetical protein
MGSSPIFCIPSSAGARHPITSTLGWNRSGTSNIRNKTITTLFWCVQQILSLVLAQLKWYLAGEDMQVIMEIMFGVEVRMAK